ncbi:MAG: Trm112 family protein [Candidatus Krumholzibacteria bacterium]|nr:Trm112 family protein [Candidatus Krumholzibacteria bacterium]
MIKRELLDILACPKCKDKVELDGAGRYLVCRRCGLRYPISEQGIPIMLIDRAEEVES